MDFVSGYSLSELAGYPTLRPLEGAANRNIITARYAMIKDCLAAINGYIPRRKCDEYALYP
jgi:hypothetical protein